MALIPVGIVGIGMVGMPLKRWFEERRGYTRGSNLFCYDIDPRKPFHDNVNNAAVVFITVPTPRQPDGSANISVVRGSIQMLDGEKIVVIKSTVPPGTTQSLQETFLRHRLLFNPEFLTEKRAWEDFCRPDRQIVGFTDQSLEAAHTVLAMLPKAPFMSPWGIGTYRQTRISATEAELIKYFGNAHFVRKINLANVFALLAAKLGVDYEHVRQGVAADHRIGDSHLNVNEGGYCGWGGYCFPKDIHALITTLAGHKLDTCAELLENDCAFNERILFGQGLTQEEVSVHITEARLRELAQKHHHETPKEERA